MGFGILFLGYFATTMMSIPLSMLLPSEFCGVIELLGYVVIIIAAKKLSEYNLNFKTVMATSFLMACISLLDTAIGVTVFLSDNQIATFSFTDTLVYWDKIEVIEYISLVAGMIFISTLCGAIKQIAQDTGVKKIEIAATRNFVFYCICLIVQAIRFLPYMWMQKYELVFVSALLILEILCSILNLYMIFTCYAKICDPDDVEMKQKSSRFEFVNKKRAEQEEERQKILDEYSQHNNKNTKRKKKKK